MEDEEILYSNFKLGNRPSHLSKGSTDCDIKEIESTKSTKKSVIKQDGFNSDAGDQSNSLQNDISSAIQRGRIAPSASSDPQNPTYGSPSNTTLEDLSDQNSINISAHFNSRKVSAEHSTSNKPTPQILMNSATHSTNLFFKPENLIGTTDDIKQSDTILPAILSLNPPPGPTPDKTKHPDTESSLNPPPGPTPDKTKHPDTESSLNPPPARPLSSVAPSQVLTSPRSPHLPNIEQLVLGPEPVHSHHNSISSTHQTHKISLSSPTPSHTQVTLTRHNNSREIRDKSERPARSSDEPIWGPRAVTGTNEQLPSSSNALIGVAGVKGSSEGKQHSSNGTSRDWKQAEVCCATPAAPLRRDLVITHPRRPSPTAPISTDSSESSLAASHASSNNSPRLSGKSTRKSDVSFDSSTQTSTVDSEASAREIFVSSEKSTRNVPILLSTPSVEKSTQTSFSECLPSASIQRIAEDQISSSTHELSETHNQSAPSQQLIPTENKSTAGDAIQSAPISSLTTNTSSNASLNSLSKSNIVENTCEDQRIIHQREKNSTKRCINSVEENKLCREIVVEQKASEAIAPISINIGRDRPFHCLGQCTIENNAASPKLSIEIDAQCQNTSVTKDWLLSKQQEVTVIEEDLQNHFQSQLCSTQPSAASIEHLSNRSSSVASEGVREKMTKATEKDLANGMRKSKPEQESDDMDKNTVETTSKSVTDEQTSKVIPIQITYNQTNEIERRVPIKMADEPAIKPPPGPNTPKQCHQTAESQTNHDISDIMDIGGRQNTSPNGHGKQSCVSGTFGGDSITRNDGEDIKLSQEEEMEAQRTLEKVYRELESAKGRLARQVIQLSSSVPPVTPHIPRVRRPTQAQRLDMIRSRSLDTRSGNYPFSQGSRTWSFKSGKEKSLEDIDKDIEIIWKELQELDSLPTSRCSSRINHPAGKSSTSAWMHPDDQCSSSPPPLSEQIFVTPSWRNTGSSSYSQYSRPSSRQSISSQTSWRSTLNSSYKSSSYHGTPVSRPKEPSHPTRNILNVPENGSNLYNSQSPNSSKFNTTTGKSEEISSPYRDKSPVSNYADEKSITIPNNHYMVPAHTFRNYNFVPRSVPINFESATLKDNSEESNKNVHRVHVENNRTQSAMASTTLPKPIRDVNISMLASEEKDFEDYEFIGSNSSTDKEKGLFEDDSFDIFINMDHSPTEENSTLTRKKDTKELIRETGTLLIKDPNNMVRQEVDVKSNLKSFHKNEGMESKSEPLVKTYVSSASLNLSNFDKENKSTPAPKKGIIDQSVVKVEIPFNANERKEIEEDNSDGACFTGEEKREHYMNDAKSFDEATKISIPIVETGIPFVGQEESQTKIKPCLKTEKNHQDSWTTLIRTRSQSPAGRSSPSKLNVNFKNDATVQVYEPSNHEHRVDYPRFKKIQISGTERKNNVPNGHPKKLNEGTALRAEKYMEKEEVVIQSEAVVDGRDKLVMDKNNQNDPQNGQLNGKVMRTVTIIETPNENKQSENGTQNLNGNFIKNNKYSNSKEKARPKQQNGSPIVPKRSKGKGQNSSYKERKNGKRFTDNGTNILNDVSTQTETNKKKGACSLM